MKHTESGDTRLCTFNHATSLTLFTSGDVDVHIINEALPSVFVIWFDGIKIPCRCSLSSLKFVFKNPPAALLKGNKSQTNLTGEKHRGQHAMEHMIRASFCCISERRSQAKSDFILKRRLTFSSQQTLYIYTETQLLASLLYTTHKKDKATHMGWHPQVTSTCLQSCRQGDAHVRRT